MQTQIFGRNRHIAIYIYFFALFFQDTCKFSDRSSLAYTVDSYDKYDRLLLLKVICGLSDTNYVSLTDETAVKNLNRTLDMLDEDDDGFPL